MSRITEIKITQKKNLGNYESFEFGLTAVIEETESPLEAIESLKKLVEWEVGKNERTATYQKLKKQVVTMPEGVEKAKTITWIERYERCLEEIEHDWLMAQYEADTEERTGLPPRKEEISEDECPF